MLDIAKAYEETQANLRTLVQGLPEDALAGRRSTGQIRAFDWAGDPETYLPLIPAYGERTDALSE